VSGSTSIEVVEYSRPGRAVAGVLSGDSPSSGPPPVRGSLGDLGEARSIKRTQIKRRSG
jgi:hypothetical protein